MPPSSPLKYVTFTLTAPVTSEGSIRYSVFGLIGPWPCLLPTMRRVESSFPVELRNFIKFPSSESAF